jgi:putative transposase
MKKRYSEEQIIGSLRDGEAGIAVKDLCRKHGFSEASYYLWKSKFDGMSVSDAKQLAARATRGRMQRIGKSIPFRQWLNAASISSRSSTVIPGGIPGIRP